MKKTVILLTTLCLCFHLFTVSLCAAPSVSARSAVVIDAKTGKILFEQDAHTRRGMASTTKIMTALVTLEHLDEKTVISVDPRACGIEGSSVYLTPGEKITVETLLYALMLQSANDAAAALAYAVAGGIEEFAALMNQKADTLGLLATHFENPHGLDGETHYTTAYELARIAAAALKNERFATIVATEKKAVPLHNGTATRLLVNHNRLLREHPDIIGVKTGFTKKCGRTLVSAAEKNGVRLICVTLNDPNDWEDHRNLLDYGFSLYEEVSLAQADEFSYDIPVCDGKSSSLTVSNTESLTLWLPATRAKITAVTELPRFLYPGIHKGDAIGQVVFYCDGQKLGAVTLYAKQSVEAPKQEKSFWRKLFPFALK